MCGIVGYVGPEQCADLVLDALKRLEYRGYDSAGIAVLDESGVDVRRCEGKLERLEQILKSKPLAGSTGIGHTRWATHGRPSEENAHPHVVDGIAVVHNGIIENHLELRRVLEKDGAKMSSETDTEIIAHLVAGKRARGMDLENSVRSALKVVKGSYAIAVLSADEADRIVVAKNASPLVVGLGDSENFVASDIPAVLGHTREFIFLDEGEVAIIQSDSVRITDLDGKEIKKASRRIDWSPVMAEKEGFKHFMLKEIFEQPKAVENTLAGRVSTERAEVNAELVGISESAALRIRRVVFVACGTSYHSSMVGKYWMESLAGLPTEVELASEYRSRGPLVDPNDLVIAVSQSGETIDTLEALKIAKSGGARVLAVANVLDSAIPRAADGSFYTHAGPEIGVASTKCFIAQLAGLFLIAVYLGRRRGTLEEERAGSILQELLEIPSLIRDVLDLNEDIMKMSRELVNSDDFLFLGRGLSFPIALEGALKLKEISYIHAEGYASGEMKHGPIALIDSNMPVAVVMPEDENFDRSIGNVQEVLARDGRVILITTEGHREKLGNLAQYYLELPRVNPLMSPLLTVLPLQLLSYHIADMKGNDVDQPRNLAKTVTVE